jgi:cytochrome P450
MRFRSSLPLHGRAAHPEGAAVSGRGSSEARRLAAHFDPFHEPYLADPYPFFPEARAATPVFYSPDLEYWVVTRYHDMRQIFQTPQVFSAANTLAPLQPICPAAGHLLAEGGFRPVPTLTNSDPPGHTRMRRLGASPTPDRHSPHEGYDAERSHVWR